MDTLTSLSRAGDTALTLYAASSRVQWGEDTLVIHWGHGQRSQPLAAYEDMIAGYWTIRTKQDKRKRHDSVDALLTRREVNDLKGWLGGPGAGVLQAAGFTVLGFNSRHVSLPVPKAAAANDPLAAWDYSEGDLIRVGLEEGLPFPALGHYLRTERMKTERLLGLVVEAGRDVTNLRNELPALLDALSSAQAAGDFDQLQTAHREYLRFRSRMYRAYWCG